jgi:hypothetical protein
LAEKEPPATIVEPAAVPAAGDTALAVRGPDHRFVYSNAHRLRITASDLSISFGVISDSEHPEAKFAVYEQATILLGFTQLNMLRRELNAFFDELDKLQVKYEVNEENSKHAEDRARGLVGTPFKYKLPKAPKE